MEKAIKRLEKFKQKLIDLMNQHEKFINDLIDEFMDVTCKEEEMLSSLKEAAASDGNIMKDIDIIAHIYEKDKRKLSKLYNVRNDIFHERNEVNSLQNPSDIKSLSAKLNMIVELAVAIDAKMTEIKHDTGAKAIKALDQLSFS